MYINKVNLLGPTLSFWSFECGDVVSLFGFHSVSVECGGFRMCPVFYVLSSFAIILLIESEMVACGRARVLASVRV